jgi:hypothetical protein
MLGYCRLGLAMLGWQQIILIRLHQVGSVPVFMQILTTSVVASRDLESALLRIKSVAKTR